MSAATQFEPVTEVEVDSRGRLSVAKAGARPGMRYRVSYDSDGDILLTPVVSVPAREALVWESPELAASIRRGIEEAHRGETHDLGSFGRYLDDDEDPED